MIMISEVSPPDLNDHYYQGDNSLFQKTTIQAFQDAGIKVTSIKDILDRGIYLTTAVKCAKIEYGLKTSTINECSSILEKEINLFTGINIFMLMGDVAIRALNYIAKRKGEPRVIPAASTYKIRQGKFFFQNKRVFPSYLQAGPSFFIEKSKRKMIAEDITSAFSLIGQTPLP